MPGLKFLEGMLKAFQPVPFAPKAAGSVRVVTFNAHHGSDPQAIAKLFKGNANLALADVVLLQEVEEHERDRVSRITRIARALKCQYKYVPARHLRLTKGTHGIAMLSRLPLTGTAAINLPYYELPLRHRPRIALKAELQIGQKRCCVYNVHLDTTLNHLERVGQLKAVIDDIQIQHSKTPIILAGDFNTIPLFMLARSIPVFYSNQKKKLHNYLSRRGLSTTCQTAGYTLRSGLVRFQLDGIYTKNAVVTQCAVERAVKISDHFPLWADIKLQ